MRGRFVTIEGLEGVGKSTQIARVADCIAAAGHAVELTREPGGTPLAERLRDIVLDAEEPLGAAGELLLMFAARALHVEQRIRPALEEGRWIVCDRFSDASHAYQGGGRGIDAALIVQLEHLVHPGLQPDLTILLDAPIELGLARARARDAERGRADRFEGERAEFFARVRQVYLLRARAEPARFRIIDASVAAETVGEAVAAAVRAFIARVAASGEAR